jgi:glycolate oxidase iron-sulfur subunit
VFFKGSSIESGLLSRFSLPVIGGGRLVPRFAKTVFLEMPEIRGMASAPEAGATARAKVAFYAGCGVNFLMPEVGLKSIGVLKEAGASVSVPDGQVCCGMPVYSAGDIGTAREMAVKNLEAFEEGGFDFITTSCATCGYGLKTLFAKLIGEDPLYRDRVERFSAKVRDITELLVNELGFKRDAGSNKPRTVVTYHDPCHLGRAQGVREEPRRLISMAKGAGLKEMKNPCACCGLGGGLSVSNYELSAEISRRKAENVKKSGASIVATACPGCMVQLRDALHRANVNAEVRHVVELL